jgi:hypothetical protein
VHPWAATPWGKSWPIVNGEVKRERERERGERTWIVKIMEGLVEPEKSLNCPSTGVCFCVDLGVFISFLGSYIAIKAYISDMLKM